jgi:hypothetical protein
MRFKGHVSYALISEFTDSRRPAFGLGDVLINPTHTAREILLAFAAYVLAQGRADAIFVTSDPRIITEALSLGYHVWDRLRTQYFSAPGGPVCENLETLPSVSFISSDEMGYRFPSNERRCA